MCIRDSNPLDSGPVQRALWAALDQWSTKGVAPPPSMVPHLAAGTLVPPMPQQGQGLPKIPGGTYSGLKSTRSLLPYAPHYLEAGIMSVDPPVITPPKFDNPKNGAIYPT